MTWSILTSRITHDGAGSLSVTLCHRYPQSHVAGALFYLTGLALPGGSTEHEVYCPVCAADRGLTVSGAWGRPALLTCCYGHSWTPGLPGIDASQLLRDVVRQSLDGGGLPYYRARLDPDSRPPTPLRDAARPALIRAADALNQRRWEFTDTESALAWELFQRSSWPDTITSANEITETDRLDWLRKGLTALRDCAAVATGPMADLLTACDTALRPAALLTLEDLEPGPDWYNPPVLLDAEQALAGLREVLHAGGTGDVDY